VPRSPVVYRLVPRVVATLCHGGSTTPSHRGHPDQGAERQVGHRDLGSEHQLGHREERLREVIGGYTEPETGRGLSGLLEHPPGSAGRPQR
jgi:hypothetical protein